MIALAFLSGVAFSFILLLAWWLCRTAKDADERMERINGGGLDVTNPPDDFTAITKE